MIGRLLMIAAGLASSADIGADSGDVLSPENLEQMPDEFFAELHLSRAQVFEFLAKHSDALSAAYWIYRKDVELLGPSELSIFHAEVDRFWLMLRLRRVISLAEFEADFLGSMDWRILPDESWEFGKASHRTDGARWIQVASLYGLGLENQAAQPPVPEPWNPTEGAPLLEKRYRAGHRVALRQIEALEGETDPFKVKVREDIRERYADLKCRVDQDFARVTALLAPGTESREKFIELFAEYHVIYGEDDPWVQTVERRLAKNDAAGTYLALIAYVDKVFGFADTSPRVAWRMLRPAFRFLWPGPPFGPNASESTLLRLADISKSYGACGP